MKIDNEQIKEKVLRNAKNMMLEYGLKGMNMKMLAQECSLAKPTLYNSIESKQVLVEKIAFDFFKETYGNFFDLILTKTSYEEFMDGTIEQLSSLTMGKLRLIQKQMILEYPSIESRVKAFINQYKIDIVNKFKELQKNNEITDSIKPETIFEFFLMTTRQMIVGEYNDNDVKDNLNDIYHIFFIGLKK